MGKLDSESNNNKKQGDEMNRTIADKIADIFDNDGQNFKKEVSKLTAEQFEFLGDAVDEGDLESITLDRVCNHLIDIGNKHYFENPSDFEYIYLFQDRSAIYVGACIWDTAENVIKSGFYDKKTIDKVKKVMR